MTTEREAFEAWWGESPVELTPLVNQSTQDKHNAWVWLAWQASRKVALEDAAEYLESRRYYGLAEHVKEMK
jgi:hypothetical protein